MRQKSQTRQTGAARAIKDIRRASLMHFTFPFESEEERIVLAFDVKEK